MIRAPEKFLLLCAAFLLPAMPASGQGGPPGDSEKGLLAAEGFLAQNGESLLESGRLALLRGDVSGAERALRLFRKYFPHRSAGVFPAEVLLAGGRNREARSLLEKLAADPREPARFKAVFALARKAFEEQNYIHAFSLFNRLDGAQVPAAWRLQGRNGAILCLMKLGQLDSAGLLLKSAAADFPLQGEYWEQLMVWVMGKAGDTDGLAHFWSESARNHSPAPCHWLYEGLTAAAAAAAVSGNFRQTERFFADAYNFAPDDGARRNCLRELIVVQKDRSPNRALRTIGRYLRYFPDAADRGEIMLIEGALLNRLEKYEQAQRIFEELLNDDYPPRIQSSAALLGAYAAEKLSDMTQAREFYETAIQRSGRDRKCADQARMKLMEFLLRTREYSSAAALGDGLAKNGEVDREALALLRISALRNLKRYEEAAEIAAKLALSADAVRSAEGIWQLAQLTELRGKLPEARERYLEFLRRFSDDRRVPDAMFAAADFAMRRRSFSAAAREFKTFIDKFPGHPEIRRALLGALYSSLRQDDEVQAEKYLARLEKDFSETSEFEQGLMEIARFLFRRGNYAKSLELLERFLKLRAGSPGVPEALLLSLRIFDKLDNHKKAVEYADRILDKFPGTSTAVEAAMCAGGNCFRAEDYGRALGYYERAAELGRGVVSLVAAGEAADCHLQLRKAENLAAARKIYRRLADQTEFPALQVQALCKLGLACEYSSMNPAALDAYEELLNLAVSSEKVRRSSGVNNWCSRAAHSALRIILGTSDMADGSQRAQRIYQLYSRLEVPGSEAELRSYLTEIQKHYNLLD